MFKEQLQVGLKSHPLPPAKAIVVEQDHQDLHAYAGVLRRMGFEVKPFTNYWEASRYLDEETPDFIFVNQGTAAFEARDFVARALARDRHTPLVVLAQSLQMNCYLEAMQLGAVDYVEKPLASTEIEHLVTTHWRPQMAALPFSPV